MRQAARESDFAGKFTWRIEHFTRLKDLLKKRKITGLCIKSKRFTIGGRDCRLIVYPRGGWGRPEACGGVGVGGNIQRAGWIVCLAGGV